MNIRIMRSVLYSILLLSLNGYSQIEAHKEPLHHPVLTNAHARILDVVAHPNDTSLVHQHSNNYCYVTIDGGKIWVQNEGEDGRTLELPRGFTGGYFDNPKQPLVHQFANRSDGLIRLIATENLSTGNSRDSVYSLLPHEVLLINNRQFLITKISIPPSGQLDFDAHLNTVMVNPAQTPLPINIQPEQLSDWLWLDAKSRISIFNPSGTPSDIVLVRLKNGD